MVMMRMMMRDLIAQLLTGASLMALLRSRTLMLLLNLKLGPTSKIIILHQDMLRKHRELMMMVLLERRQRSSRLNNRARLIARRSRSRRRLVDGVVRNHVGTPAIGVADLLVGQLVLELLDVLQSVDGELVLVLLAQLQLGLWRGREAAVLRAEVRVGVDHEHFWLPLQELSHDLEEARGEKAVADVSVEERAQLIGIDLDEEGGDGGRRKGFGGVAVFALELKKNLLRGDDFVCLLDFDFFCFFIIVVGFGFGFWFFCFVAW